MTEKRTDFMPLPNKLRVNPELGDAIRAIAERNYRTVNAQILMWLVEAVKRENVKSSAVQLPAVASLERKEKRA